jgi:hypothetical protein
LLDLRFEPSAEEIVCATISVLTLIASLAGLFWKRKA